MKKLCLFLSLLSASLALGQSQSQGPLTVSGGDTIQVTTNTVLTDKDDITVTLTPVPKPPPGGCEVATIPPIGSPAAKSFSFSIPAGACLGQYQISATKTTDPKVINISSPQTIQVNERPPVVTGIDPVVMYRTERDGAPSWKLVFLGPSTLKAGLKYSVRFKDRALPLCGIPENSPASPATPPSGTPPQPSAPEIKDPKDSDVPCHKPVDSTNGQIAFLVGGKDFLDRFSGKQSVSLVLDGANSAPQDIHIVDASRHTPRNYAIGITAALVVLIYVLLSSRGRTMHTATGGRTSLLTKLFMDEETKSYSLSKCQFYAWTFAAILGYIFLAVSKSIVQGSAVFPDIPEGLPSIILYSAGTSVLATAITSTRGSKGAGEDAPTLADFITNGGVVAPERLQFVVWTITGIFTFLTIVFKSDPMTLSDLPRIPDGFMNLMGISSAGYLAGKLARKPGPVIRGIKVGTLPGAGVPSELPLVVTGENLDPNCKIKVDGQPIRDQLVTVTGTADPQTKFCKELTITIREASDLVVGTHTLTVVNSDAQAADVSYPTDAMTLLPVTGVAHGTVLTEVRVSGDHFVANSTAVWKDPDGNVSPEIPAQSAVGAAPATAGVVFRDAKNVSVWLVPGTTTGPGELTLISPARLRARTTVTVV